MLQNPPSSPGELRSGVARVTEHLGHHAHDTPLSAFVTEVVCTVGATYPRTAASPPRTAASPPVNGGNCASRGPVRDVLAGGIAIKWGELHH